MTSRMNPLAVYVAPALDGPRISSWVIVAVRMLMWFEVVAVQKLAVVLDHYAAGLALLRIRASWRAKGHWCVNPPFAALKTVFSHR